jgi:hypothetical protein
MENARAGAKPRLTAIINIIQHRSWEKRQDANSVPFTSFEALVQHPYWHGLKSVID